MIGGLQQEQFTDLLSAAANVVLACVVTAPWSKLNHF